MAYPLVTGSSPLQGVNHVNKASNRVSTNCSLKAIFVVQIKTIMNLIRKIPAAAVLAIVLAGSCSSAEKKVENAEENIEEAREDLREERQDSISDYKEYRLKVETRIAENEARIAELRADIKNQSKEAREDYREQIDRLEKKNNELRMKIGEYKKTSREKWEEFKKELDHDLEGLGNSLKNFGKDNK